MSADRSMHNTAIFATMGVNVAIFLSMATAGVMHAPKRQSEPVEWINVAPVELPKLGEEKPEKMLPRIIETPEPPPPETDVASLSRQKKEEELEKKKKDEKKKRELAEKKRRDAVEHAKDLERKKAEEEKKKREQAMKYALRKLERDRRADEDSPEGMADGDRMGTDPNAKRNKAVYMNRVVHAIKQQFTVPSVIPRDLRKKLRAVVAFRVDKNGKLKGQPSIQKSSRNKIFDEAVLATLRKFGPGSRARIPIPPLTQAKLRRSVLGNGLTIEMRGDD